MTVKIHKSKSALPIAKSIFVFSLFMLFSILGSDIISAHTLNGFLFAINVILPTVFPFMVFSDIASHCFSFEKSRILRSVFERSFKIGGVGISAFLSGIIGGFPIGAKAALNLYNDGKISKCECERLMCFSNIPSAAYVISALGTGILSSFKTGVLLYITVIISAVICAFIIGTSKSYTDFTGYNTKQNYSFVKSLKSAATSSVNVIFFISFFSGICGFIKSLPIPNILKCLFITVTEVGGAALYISESCIFARKLSLALIGFTLSFSGFSVIMQSLAFDTKNEISVIKCVFYKLLQGLISFIIILLLPL